MSKHPLNFGVAGIFGRMGQNPSINALTNANAIAQQQLAQQNIQPLGSGTTYRPDMSQQVMTGSFDPLTQQVGMGIFGDQNARNMAVRGSGLMMNTPMLKALGSEPNVDPCSAEFDYEIATDAGHSAEDIKKYREANCKSGSPAQHKRTGAMAEHEHMRPGETKTEFRNRISGKPGETSEKLRQEYIEKADNKNK